MSVPEPSPTISRPWAMLAWVVLLALPLCTGEIPPPMPSPPEPVPPLMLALAALYLASLCRSL
ncbi:hypothetical protein D3C78_1982470 [compost metagenome]